MAQARPPIRVCFVCLGNICRSPTAEGVFRKLVGEAGLAGAIEIDSASTGGWHVGESPDPRTAAAARRHGVGLDHSARQVRREDFATFHYLIAMDRSNRRHLDAMTPAGALATVRLLREHEPGASLTGGDADVPDPYYGGDDGFDEVFRIRERACRGLLDQIPPRARPLTMDANLRAAVAGKLGSEVVAARPVAGGDINRAFDVALRDERRVFVKANPRAPAGMFEAEAAGLAWLGEAEAIRVPRVLAVGDAAPAFLALEFIAPGAPRSGFDEEVGRGLAALHRRAPPGFGLDHPNFIGRLAQDNTPEPTWAAFYRARRLEPQIVLAAKGGLVSSAMRARFDRLLHRLPDLAGDSEPVARLHGDLWGGNLHVAPDGAPVLIDPAVYGGHREVDLAMMRLFGGFSQRVFAAYDEAWPLAAGWEDRVPLYQLYPLLVHVNLFGGAYVAQVDRALRALA